jgi:hypothetical protein
MGLVANLLLAAIALFTSAWFEWDAPRAIPLAILGLFAAVGAVGAASLEVDP